MADAFEVRSSARPTPAVSNGATIKLGRRKERFWARVVKVRSDGSVVCTIDNYLQRNSDLEYGQELTVGMPHVLEVASIDDEAAFFDAVRRAMVARASDPVEVAALRWRDVRLRDGVGLPASSTSTFMVGTGTVGGEEPDDPNAPDIAHVIHPSTIRGAASVASDRRW